MPENGDEIQSDIVFHNPHIKEVPPSRPYYYVEYSGEHRGHPFSVKFNKITMGELRENYKNRRIDMPLIQGNWGRMNLWIENMWEALYNPIWQLQLRPEADRKYAIISGHHRFRLLDAMDASHIWFFDVSYPSYEAGRWRVGIAQLPKHLNKIAHMNSLPPLRGTMSGVCDHCGKNTSWKLKTINKIDDVRMFCPKCGRENPYPWPGRL